MRAKLVAARDLKSAVPVDVLSKTPGCRVYVFCIV